MTGPDTRPDERPDPLTEAITAYPRAFPGHGLPFLRPAGSPGGAGAGHPAAAPRRGAVPAVARMGRPPRAGPRKAAGRDLLLTGRPPASDLENAAREAMLAAADRYRERFGKPFGTWEFMDHAREVARELDAAVESSKRVTEAQWPSPASTDTVTRLMQPLGTPPASAPG